MIFKKTNFPVQCQGLDYHNLHDLLYMINLPVTKRIEGVFCSTVSTRVFLHVITQCIKEVSYMTCIKLSLRISPIYCRT